MGSTIPRLLRDDPELATLFGVGGVRGRLAMQLEVSGVVRDDPELTAFLAANALCAALAPRLACEAPAPTNDDQGMVQPGPRR